MACSTSTTPPQSAHLLTLIKGPVQRPDRSFGTLHGSGTRRTQALTEQQITDLVNQAGSMVDVLHDANPEIKRQTYAALGLRCDYNHAQRKMQVRSDPDLHSLANHVGQWVVSEGDTHRCPTTVGGGGGAGSGRVSPHGSSIRTGWRRTSGTARVTLGIHPPERISGPKRSAGRASWWRLGIEPPAVGAEPPSLCAACCCWLALQLQSFPTSSHQLWCHGHLLALCASQAAQLSAHRFVRSQ